MWRRVLLTAQHPLHSRYILELSCGHVVERQRMRIIANYLPSPLKARCEACQHRAEELLEGEAAQRAERNASKLR